MSRPTERTINAGAIRTEGPTSNKGTSLGQLSSSKLMSSPSRLACLAEPQPPEKPTQSTPSPSIPKEGSTPADGPSFDTYRKLVAERVKVAETRRADAEDIIISVRPFRNFTQTYSSDRRRPLCLRPLSPYLLEHPFQDSNLIRMKPRRFILQEPPKCSPTPVGCRSTSLICHPILPNLLHQGRLYGSIHSGF